ncbi:MAG: DUF4114 domain-containing protein, partial [Acidobacteriota bacterium]|nr:DUF4114 domain-containing protein [Acidobacteriota bacterium]
PASFFRNGTVAAANSASGNNYWQFVPNSVRSDGSDYDGYFEHPGAYLYIDNNANQIPDILEYRRGDNKIPPYAVDKSYATEDLNGDGAMGLLGAWDYAGTPGNTVDDKYHWNGSTIFYIADDDGGSGQTSYYLSYTPYGNQYSDIMGSTNGHPDYLIYGTSDISDPAIPDVLKNEDDEGNFTAVTDPRGEEMWRYRWYESNISGAREMVFFLVVFWNSGGARVQTYYSKAAFNQDSAPGSPSRNGNTSGDDYGGRDLNNWFPHFQNSGDHDALANEVWGHDWDELATAPTDGSSPQVLANPANSSITQEWVDEFENYRTDRRIIQYRALRDWFSGTAVDANTVINGRYGIDMSAEGDSSITRANNGNMVHLMVGAPSATKDAWLLGWEDLFGGGDRDFEDVVFYVKREAGGQLQSLNVADSLGDAFAADADYSLSQADFTFEDNFTDDLWGVEKRYVNYYYRFGNADEWIPLLGGQHLRTPDVFQPDQGGSTSTTGSQVTRTVSRQVAEKATELYWKVEMSTDNVDTFQPEVTAATVGYQSLVHDFYYNSAVIPNSNINYFASFESPDHGWSEQKNRGHLYALQTFEHGNPAIAAKLPDSGSPESTPESQPVATYASQTGGGSINLFKWDAGVTLKNELSEGRNIYTYLGTNLHRIRHTDSLTLTPLSKDKINTSIRNAMDLDATKVNGVWLNNFHDPGAEEQDQDSASLWLTNWIHGYDNPLVVDGAVVARDATRDWLLGGINRASPMVIRAPGLPSWIEDTIDSAIPIKDRTSYLNFVESKKDTPTRVIIGSESGLLHCFDAGKWVGEPETAEDGSEYEWADGHYEDDNFGDGSEIWAILPGHLLEDVKYNYTNANPIAAGVVASSDATGVYTVIKTGSDDWRRVVILVQGYQGGSMTAGGAVMTGNAVWALDITDPDNPIPLWQRQERRVRDLVNPPAMSWMEIGGSPRWVTVFSSGGTPSPDQKPAFFIVDAYTGELITTKGQGSSSSKGVDTMMGTPGLVDSDFNGYGDLVVGATSEGRIFVYDVRDSSTKSITYNGESFYIAPNIEPKADGTLLITAVSGDSPLVYDEVSGAVNSIYVLTYDTEKKSFTEEGVIDLPAGHKVFSRPKIIGEQLVVGTTTGDTFNFCDADINDPGGLFLYDLSQLGIGDPLEDSISNYGSVLAPIIVANARIFAHTTTSNKDDLNEQGSVYRIPQTGNFAEPLAQISIGETFGILGWQDRLMEKIRSSVNQ